MKAALEHKQAGRAGDVSGRCRCGGRRRHRRTRHRRRASRQGPVQSAAASSPTSSRPWIRTRPSFSRTATRAQVESRRAAISTPASRQAAHTVEATYSTHVITHVCLETHAVVCEWEGDKLTAWISTQAVHGTAQQFAQASQDSADQRSRDHAVHGRRLRQQVADWRRRLSSARGSRRRRRRR